MMNYYIGIDIGTSALKSVLFDSFGNQIGESSYEYDIIVKKNGYAEENPLDWYNACIKTLKDISSLVNPKDIKGIGLSGQMHGLVMLDKDDNILYNSIIWCDNRTGLEAKEIEGFGKEKIRKITGNYPMPAFTLAKLLWVKNNLSEIYEKIDKIMLPKDYIRYRLTHEFKTEYSDASGMQMMDLKTEDYSKEILDYKKKKKSILPPIVESSSMTGYLTEEIAKLTGIPTSCFLVGGAGDQAAGAIGLGVVSEGDVSISLGSSGVVFSPVDDTSNISESIQIFHHAIKGRYHVMGVTNGCGTSLKWYKDNMCKYEIKEAKEAGENIYDFITKDIDTISPGCNGLIYLPYIMGERTPHLNTLATGSFIGIRHTTTKEMISRSIIEGISYSMKDCFDLINWNTNNVIISGGGARNPKWCNIISSMINKNIKTTKVSEAPALGVAILAMVSNKEYLSIEDACLKIIKVNKEYKPNDKLNRIYNEYFKIYKECYIQNKKIYEMTEGVEKNEKIF